MLAINQPHTMLPSLFAVIAATLVLAPPEFCGLAASAAAQDNRAQDAKTIVMKLSGSTINDSNHEWLKRFSSLVEKNSGGRIRGEVYPASQLGTIPRQIEGVQLGSIQLAVVPPEFLVGVDPRFELLAAPGLFQNEDHVIKTITDPAFAEMFLAIGNNKGLVGVGILLSGPASFVMRAPLRKLEDFRGKKIRVLASPFQTEQIARLGGTGVPLSLGDVLPALQQGTIDGALGSVPVFSTFQYQDTAKYITEPGQSYVSNIVVLSRKWFDGLPAALQNVLRAAAMQIDKEMFPWSLEFLANQRRAWIEKGGELIALSPNDRAELIAKTRTVGDDIVKAKPELKLMWDLLVTTARRNF
jgi:TRAP-type C4-dicarboxylate transport system substrate-binding protein